MHKPPYGSRRGSHEDRSPETHNFDQARSGRPWSGSIEASSKAKEQLENQLKDELKKFKDEIAEQKDDFVKVLD